MAKLDCSRAVLALAAMVIPWGSAVANPVEPPSATPSNDPRAWIGVDDYPASAMRAQQQGTVAVKLFIDQTGRVAACTITQSSGSGELDAATCALMTRRARFAPRPLARGAQFAGIYAKRTRWVFPGTENAAVPRRSLADALSAVPYRSSDPRTPVAQSSDSYSDVASQNTAKARQNVEKALMGAVYISGTTRNKQDEVDTKMQDTANRAHQTLNVKWHFPKIYKVVFTSDCVTHVWGSGFTFDATLGDYSRPGNVMFAPGDYDLDWRELEAARVDNGKVALRWKAATRETLVYTDYDAQGVAESINYLREKCSR